MTKHCPPLSIEAAIARIAGQLPGGFTEVAAVAQRATSTVYNWCNPTLPDDVPMGCAIRLDCAYQAAGGIGAPIYEAYTVALDLAGTERFAGPMALGRLAPDVIRETGEANAWLVQAAQPGATAADRRRSATEIEEAIAKLQQVLLALASDASDHLHQTGPPIA